MNIEWLNSHLNLVTLASSPQMTPSEPGNVSQEADRMRGYFTINMDATTCIDKNEAKCLTLAGIRLINSASGIAMSSSTTPDDVSQWENEFNLLKDQAVK